MLFGIMVISKDIRRVLDGTAPRVVLTTSDFGIPTEYQPALVVALNRMVASGKLERIGKGKYYKPKNSVFGSVPPDTSELIKDFLQRNNSVVGYVTGVNAFSKLGLTTQISSTITIGTNKYRSPMMRGNIKIVFLLQPNKICKQDVELYIILDALRLIREIPGTTPNNCVDIIMNIIKSLPQKSQSRLSKLAIAYTPFVRALLGAIYENLLLPCDMLKKSLNGTTNYFLPISEEVLPTKRNWRII